MTNDGDLEPREYQALAEFRYQIRSFVHFSEQAAQAEGLSQQQHQLLLAVKSLSFDVDPTIGQLAERLRLQHHSTVELVDRLCLGGLVRRDKDTVDQRRIRIRMTRRGSSLLRKLAVAHQTELQTVGPALIQTLQRLIASTNNEKPSPKARPGRSR